MKWIQDDVLILLPHTVWVSQCEEECLSGSNIFVKFSCESSLLPAIYSTSLTGVSGVKANQNIFQITSKKTMRHTHITI